MRRVFVNGSGDRCSIPGRVIPKTQKIVVIYKSLCFDVAQGPMRLELTRVGLLSLAC